MTPTIEKNIIKTRSGLVHVWCNATSSHHSTGAAVFLGVSSSVRYLLASHHLSLPANSKQTFPKNFAVSALNRILIKCWSSLIAVPDSLYQITTQMNFSIWKTKYRIFALAAPFFLPRFSEETSKKAREVWHNYVSCAQSSSGCVPD